MCSDDLEYLSTLASLPAQQTAFEYLIGSWKRLNAIRTAFVKKVGCDESFYSSNVNFVKGYPPLETQKGLELLEKIRHLVVSYTGLNLQEPEMFSQPEGYVVTLHMDNPYPGYIAVDQLAHRNLSLLSCPSRRCQHHSFRRRLLAQIRLLHPT